MINLKRIKSWPLVIGLFILMVFFNYKAPKDAPPAPSPTHAVAPQPTSTQNSSPEPRVDLPNDVARAWTGDDQFVLLWSEAGMSYYVDRKLVLRQGNIVKYGLITNIEGSMTPVSSSITVFTVDCMQHAVNVGLSRSYSHQFGSGDLLIVSDIRKMGNSFETWTPEMRHPQILCALTQ